MAQLFGTIEAQCPPGSAWQHAGGWLSKRTVARMTFAALIVAASLATIGFNYFTVTRILHAPTRVPRLDEWAMIQEFILYKRGSPLFPILWSSYWGHRLVIPRLIFFANLQWASGASLTWLTFAIQSIQCALLCTLSWVLNGRRSRALFAVSVTLIVKLMFSPLQMENFVWNIQFMFPLVYAAASAAFLCLALSRDNGRLSLLLLCVTAAAIASYTMPNGLLVWPVLIAQAIYLKLKRSLTIAIALLGAVIFASYCWHYETPPLGLGAFGMLRHPLDAVMLVGLLLGGTLNSISLRLGIAVILLALAGAAYMLANALRDRSYRQSWLSALAAIIVFLFLSAASVVAGRLSPQWLADNTAVPSRYYTLTNTFWSALAILILYIFSHKPILYLYGHKPALALVGFYGALYLCLMFLNPRVQESAYEDWSDLFRGADAVGAALIVDAPDEKLLSVLWPLKPQRDDIVAFLRRERLAVFAEPRAAWQGRRVSELFPPAGPDRCIGGVERELPLNESAADGSWRVEGWAWDTSTNRGLEYLLIADPAGSVVGIARGGFRHRYFPGFFTDTPAVPVYHVRFPASEWLGYVRQPVKSRWTVYGLRPRMDRICMIEDRGN
jgi:hypothetical protein